MNSEIIAERLKQLALSIIYYARSIPFYPETAIIRGQIIRSATSAAANSRAARCARSKKEWFAKISIVVEEIDET